MPTLKTKMSKSAWVLIALLVIAIVALPILHFTGFIDLSFIGDGFLGLTMWGSESVINVALMLGGFFLLGMLTWYALKKYIFGTKVPVTTYTPLGSTIPQQESKEEVTVT
jgi:hypothetical protein